MEEVQTNNTDAKVVASLLGDSNNKVARYKFLYIFAKYLYGHIAL